MWRSPGIGSGQSWQDVTLSRAPGITYTNATGKPIEVSIFATVSNSMSSLFVDGQEVARLQLATSWGWQIGQLVAVVPPGSSYATTAAFNGWKELR